MSFVKELRRRNVIRVAIAYMAASWLLTEVASTLMPLFGVPDWGLRLVVILLALGFIPALVISWVYEITPDGVKREKEIVREESITHLTARRLDLITISLIAVALLIVAADRYWPRAEIPPPEIVSSEAADTGSQSESAAPVADLREDPSVAALPFTNRSANPDDAFFVDGIHSDLLAHLSRIDKIRTISRTSVMGYRDSNKSLTEIAGELGVAAILEGGVQRAGTQVRINVQLIDARRDEPIWAEIYDRELTVANLFDIQTEIAARIADGLEATLSPDERSNMRLKSTDNLEAYEAYLLGKQRYALTTFEGFSDALRYFRKAVDIDPNFTLAWVGIADALVKLAGARGFALDVTLDDARAAAETALDLDANSGEAYTSLCEISWREGQQAQAKVLCEQALELRPNYPPLSRLYGILLWKDPETMEEALAWREASIRLDPMSAELRRSYATALRALGRVDEAVEQLNKALEIDPDHPGARDAIATIEWQVYSRLDRAVQHFHTVINIDPDSAIYYGFLAQLYLDLAQPRRARALFDRAVALAPQYRFAAWHGLLLSLYDGTDENIDGYAENVLREQFGALWHTTFSMAQLSRRALTHNEIDAALEVYSSRMPQLLVEDDPAIGLYNYRAAIDLAIVLQRAGDYRRAAFLLDRAEDFIQGQPRLGWWGGYWIADVRILALRGSTDEALAALQQAVDEGWRSLWWYYMRHDLALTSIRDEPGFKVALEQLEADAAMQMQRVREMEQEGAIVPIHGVTFTE